MAADAPLVTPYHPGDPIPVSLSGDDADESCGCWEMLSRSVHRLGAAGEAVKWGDEFGVSWMVNLAERLAGSGAARRLHDPTWPCGRRRTTAASKSTGAPRERRRARRPVAAPGQDRREI